jgi:hypothetical protein
MILRKNSEHGLGHLLNPLNPEDGSTDWIKDALDDGCDGCVGKALPAATSSTIVRTLLVLSPLRVICV